MSGVLGLLTLSRLCLGCVHTVTDGYVGSGNEECGKLTVKFDRFVGKGFIVLAADVPCKVTVYTGYSASSELSSVWVDKTTGVFYLGTAGYAEVRVYPEKKTMMRWFGGYLEKSCQDLYLSTTFRMSELSPPSASAPMCLVDGLLRDNSLEAETEHYLSNVDFQVCDLDAWCRPLDWPRDGVYAIVKARALVTGFTVWSSPSVSNVTIGKFSASGVDPAYYDGSGSKVTMSEGACGSFSNCGVGVIDTGTGDDGKSNKGKIIAAVVCTIILIVILALISFCCYYKGKCVCLDRRIEYIRHKAWKESSSGVIETKKFSEPVCDFTVVAASDKFNGILHHVGKSVKVTTSSSTLSEIPVETVQSAEWNLKLPDEGNDAWIRFAFAQSVCVESYAIKELPGSDTPWFWQLEGSNDGTTWELIDNRCQVVSKGTETFACNGWTYTFFPYIRFHQTLNTSRGKALNLNGLEFYGKVRSSSRSLPDDGSSSSSESS